MLVMSVAPYVTPRSPACPERELVAAVREGDDGACGQLYTRYRGRIGAYVRGMVGDQQRAEDIAQEVFISALRRLRGTDQPIAFKPWIYEIAKNACIDEFRRHQRLREVPLGDDAREPSAALYSRAPMPHEAVQSKQRLEDLRGAFRSLSDNHHQVIVMRELEGMSYAQIGDRLGMSKPMVESTLFRARRRLSEEYDELVSGRRCEQVQSVIASGGERPLRKLGLRERRQLARHLAHCQPCRRHARLAGVDESLFTVPSVAKKLAALLPLPWLRLRRGEPVRRSRDATRRLASGGRLQATMSMADATSGAPGLVRALATAGAIVAAVAGGGYAVGLGGHHQGSRGVPGGSVAPAAAVVHGTHHASPGRAATRQLSRAATAAGTATPAVHSARTSTRTTSTRKPGTSGGGSGSGTPIAGGGPGSVVSRTTGAVTKTLGAAQSSASGLVSKTTGTVSGTVSGASSTVSQTVGSVSSTVGSVSNLAGSVTSKVAPTVGSVTSTVTNPVNQVTSQVTTSSSSSSQTPVQNVANVVSTPIP